MNKYADLCTAHSDITGLVGGAKAEGAGGQISGGSSTQTPPAAPPAAPPPMRKK